jgi:hypothetical protein
MEMRIHHGVVVLGIALAVLAPRQDPATQAQTAQTGAAAPAQPQSPATVPSDVSGPVEEDLGAPGDHRRHRHRHAIAVRRRRQMARARQSFPFEFVIMLGDNIYGSERPQDFAEKFEKPYATLLTQKVPFYAALGNHDDPTQRYYKPFNMNGERFYTFTKGDARFFAWTATTWTRRS